MSDYSHVNLTEVEDQAPNLGLDPEQFNLRFGRVALNCEHCGVSYLRFAPGAKAHGHRHKVQEEIYVLVPPHVMRGIKGGPEGAEVIAVGAPNTGPGDGDAPDPNWRWD
jgi:hypothetical protein